MKLKHHWELDVYKLSVKAGMEIFRESKSFPKEETYSLTDQVRRSSRAVSSAIGEAWRRRRYAAVFLNKLNKAEGEAGETQVWLEYAVKCGYIPTARGCELHRAYDQILGKLVLMINRPEPWLLKKTLTA